MTGTMNLAPSDGIVQRCRAAWRRIIEMRQSKERRKIQEHLERHQYTLSPEVRIELERRCAGQYGD